MTSFDNIPVVTTPFADDDTQKDFSFLGGGIDSKMTVPTETGGLRFTRHQMNGIGYLATIGAFLDRIGYPYGKERLDPSAFGGYPKGAILMTQDDDFCREYMSRIDNNTHPLPKEASDGTYEGDEYWQPTIPTSSASFFPNMGIRNVIWSGTIKGRANGSLDSGNVPGQDVLVSSDGWYLVERTFRATTDSETGYTQLPEKQFRISLNHLFLVELPGVMGVRSSYIFPAVKGDTINLEYGNTGTSTNGCDVKVSKIGEETILS